MRNSRVYDDNLEDAGLLPGIFFILHVMKDKLVPLIIVLFVAWVSYAYESVSVQKEVGLDNVYREFGGLANVLPRDANVSVVPYMAKDADSTDLLRGFMFIRLVLAPRHFTLQSRYDTVLTLFDRRPTEAEERTTLQGRQVLWRKKVDDCLFLLTCSSTPKP